MHQNIFSPPHSVIIFLLFILFLASSVRSSDGDDEKYTTCSSNFFQCGKLENISYPFWGNDRPYYCGQPKFKLDCDDGYNATIQMDSIKYRVIDIFPKSQILKIARWDFSSSLCPDNTPNTTLDLATFNYNYADQNVMLFYNCERVSYSSSVLPNEFSCLVNNTPQYGYYFTSMASNSNDFGDVFVSACEVGVVVPVLKVAVERLNNQSLELQEVLNEGFEVGWISVDETECIICNSSGGKCGYNNRSSNTFTCFCVDGDHPRSCLDKQAPAPAPGDLSDPPASTSSSSNPINWRVKLGIGFGAAGFTFAIMLVVFFICQRRNRKKYVAPSSYVSRNISSDYSSMSDLEKMGSYFGVHLFTYEELEEATDNFDSSKELGDGGFGTVYYGKLRDGRVVAVKRLYESNYKRVEQFMNEVEILTRLRHRHLVLLYGCTSRHSRELLLVYEYISNGTVADHLHGERAKPKSLPWPIRLKIAIETASALAYLHASDIIHRDVKTNNILLDDHFCVKVADFGLSRLFPTDVTHISTAPQGTPGYVDPDYHQCYQLTDKSDVYSFGVVLIELISSKPAVDITRHRHEINLSNMAINKIQNRELHELVDPSIGFESDCTIKMMVTAVAALAFQCLQSEKDMRPTMEEVFGSLKDILQYNEKPAEEVNIPADDVEKLKSVQPPLPLSPVSVTANWVISSSSTPNGSG